MSSGLKLSIGAGVVVVVTAYMAYVGASDSWQYYATADECLANLSEFAGRRIRVSGTVSEGSLQVASDRSQATFSLQGNDGQLAVICTGPLPDNLSEAKDVVVEGRLESDGLLRGDKLLTRCASKYESERVGASSSRD